MSNGPDDRRDRPDWPPPPPGGDPWARLPGEAGQPASGWGAPGAGDPGWGVPPAQPDPWGQAPPAYGQPPGYDVPPPEGGLLENAVKVVTAPVDTLRRLTHHPRTGWSVLVVAVVGLLGFVAAGAGMDTTPAADDPFAPGMELEALRGVFIVGGVIFGPVFALLFVVVWTAILHGMARLLKGTGTFAGTFTGVSFAYVVTVLSVPFQLLPIALGSAGTLLAGLVAFGVGIWSLVLDAVAVRECHHLSTGRAVAAVLVPIAVFFVLGILFIILIVALVIGGLAGLAG